MSFEAMAELLEDPTSGLRAGSEFFLRSLGAAGLGKKW
jgi:hypothetical protein